MHQSRHHARMTPLTLKQLTAALATLPAWKLEADALTRTFTYANFTEALAFMNDAAPEIERLNHHPEWTNVYNRVMVRLTTHDAGNKVTLADVELAKTLDWVAIRFQ